MNIYRSILKKSRKYLQKQATSITMGSGEVRKFTYKMIFDLVEQYVEKLKLAGITKGDRVIIVAENSPEWQVAFLAILKIEATVVLIDETLPYYLLKLCIEEADAKAMYTSYTVKEKLGSASQYRMPILNLSKNGQHFSDSYGVLSPFMPKTQDPMPEIAVILYDIKAKNEMVGIMYTHNSLIEQVKVIEAENTLSNKDRVLSLLQNSHIEGLVMGTLVSLWIGAPLHYTECLDEESVAQSFKNFKPTLFIASDLILAQLQEILSQQLDEQRLNKDYLDSYRTRRKKKRIRFGNIVLKPLLALLGGKVELIWSFGVLNEKVLSFYYALGIDILHFYSFPETNAPVLGNREYDLTLNTYGRPYPGVEIKLMYPNQQGEGEMYIKSRYNAVGYFRNQLLYEKNFEEGWFKTNVKASLVNKEYVNVLEVIQKETHGIEASQGLANKSFSAYYWFMLWKKTAQYLYPKTIVHEAYLPEDKGYILYVPFETDKGYMALVTHYSKSQFFKFAYLTNEEANEASKIENEAFGKIYFSGEQPSGEIKEICTTQLKKGWTLIIKAPKDAINAPFTNDIIEMAIVANVPIIPTYLKGEETINEGIPRRSHLTLMYSKPIQASNDRYTIRKMIQTQLTALIENKIEEESELDEMTQYALELLSTQCINQKIIKKERKKEDGVDYKNLSDLLINEEDN